MPDKPSLTLRRHLKAPPAKVWSAFTEPALLMRWWGPKDTVTSAAELDARVGGRFLVISHTPDGEEHQVGGVYREVAYPEKLVFSWAWRSTPERESLVTVKLSPDGTGTLLTLTHEQFFDEAARDRHQGGWGEALDRMERLFGE
ncbi:SRPBCC family protein [Phreatobacter stygius]|uniref:SRPBCC domain-containing protein n=1 Tax=Phreatobacter stygius TaxID=1940610 RepID=A0A4D7B9I9_9HYPH|nr:SRPBCC domain-containing protein [Phreatobacter stygius]QCI67210.1 SRPBCC domain-containing protein [Phreatobacter stygius]